MRWKLQESDREAADPWTGLGVGLATLAAMIGLDLLLGVNDAVVGVYAIPPFITAVLAGPRATAAVAAAAAAAGAASGFWNDNLGDDDWIARVVIIAAAGVIAVLAARATTRSRVGISRLRLLDRVGRIADGSLPLPETLERITEAVVPAFSDLCMIDTISRGDVRRIGVRASGAEAERIETAIRDRTPNTPQWLRDPESDSLDPHHVAPMPDEVLRGMANDPEDLEFLRWLRPNSYIVAPLVSRGRSLGVLTVVRVGDHPRLDSDEVDFATALSSRIGIALDNAGLFSDLESVERRMDSVMSNISEAVFVHDGGGALVYSNEAAAQVEAVNGLEALAGEGESVEKAGFELRDETGAPMDPRVASPPPGPSRGALRAPGDRGARRQDRPRLLAAGEVDADQ